MIVVDLGCKTYSSRLNNQESIGPLIERFHPELLLGFDPNPELEEGVTVVDGTVVVTRRLAASTGTGTARFTFDGTSSRFDPSGKSQVDTFDLARLIDTLPGLPVVKMDVEGAERQLLQHLFARGTDKRIGLLLVERHGDWPIPPVSCKVEEWA